MRIRITDIAGLYAISLHILAARVLPLGLIMLLCLPASPLPAEVPRTYAMTDVRIVTAPGQVIESGTVVLRDGLIEAVGAAVRPPPDARIIETKAGWTVYPAFIDAASGVGLPAEGGGGSRGRGEQPERLGAPHELAPVQPETRVLSQLSFSHDSINRHRRLGFAQAHVLPSRGVFRGESTVIMLRAGPPAELVARDRVAQVVALERQSFMARQYPSSRIGAIALVRQVLLDAGRQAEWNSRYTANPSGMAAPQYRSSDEPLMAVLDGQRPVLFIATSPMDPPRFRSIADEFGINGMVLAQDLADRADQLRAGAMPVLLPLELPAELPVASENQALHAGLAELQQQLNAPRLAQQLAGDDVRFAFVTQGVKDLASFHANLAAVIKAGLTPEQALAALTTTPAALLGIDRVTGSIVAGKQANLLVVEGELFTDKPAIKHLFVQGYHEEIKAEEENRGRGRGGRPGGRPTAALGGEL